jgi:hypothetical protein
LWRQFSDDFCHKCNSTIGSTIKPIIPITIEAWEDYHTSRGALKLTRLEVEAIKKIVKDIDQHLFLDIDSDNQREKAEWEEKAKKLGFK